VETIETYLSVFPRETDVLRQLDCLVVDASGDLSQDQWSQWLTFSRKVLAGETADVTMVCFTIEGDPCPFYLQYDGTDFFLLTDTTRDQFGGEAYTYRTYSYLQFVAEPLEETADDGSAQWRLYAILTDAQISSLEDLAQLPEGCPWTILFSACCTLQDSHLLTDLDIPLTAEAP
jgi:hypothetical protein